MKILAIGDFHGKFLEKLRKLAKSREIDLVIALGDYAGLPEWIPFIRNQLRLIKEGKKPLGAEDYFGKKAFKKLLEKDDAAGRNVLKILNSFGKKTIFIFGNGDDTFYDYPFESFFKASKKNKKFLKTIKNMINITYSKTKLQGIAFAGFGGFVDPDSHLERGLMKKDRKLYFRILKRQKRSRAKLFSILRGFTKSHGIFVLHYPPKGAFDIVRDRKNPYNGKNIGTSYLTEAIKKYSPRLVLCGHMHEYQGKKMLGKSLVVNPGTASEGKAAIIDYKEKDIKVRFIR